jgi:hypothetical protein
MTEEELHEYFDIDPSVDKACMEELLSMTPTEVIEWLGPPEYVEPVIYNGPGQPDTFGPKYYPGQPQYEEALKMDKRMLVKLR